MVIRRRTRVKIDFDMYKISGNVFLGHFSKEIDTEEEPPYESREEADLDGTIDEWATNVAKLMALDAAAKWVGADTPEDLTITEVSGVSFKAINIMGTFYPEYTKEEEELPPPPKCQLTRADIGYIEVRLREIMENLDLIDYVMEKEREIDAMLMQRGCTREDIRDLIARYKLTGRMLR